MNLRFLLCFFILYHCEANTSSLRNSSLNQDTIQKENQKKVYDVQVDGPNCPGTKYCINCCPFGRSRDDEGCLICDCLKKENIKEEKLLHTDMHENERWDKDGENCPGIDHCWTCCPLGRIRDDQGCLKCDCIKKGNFSDILISESNYDAFFERYGITSLEKDDGRTKRAANKRAYLWTHYKKGSNYIIPYTFERSSTSYFKRIVQKGIEHFNARTCIRFLPKKRNQYSYVEFTPFGGCASYVGDVFAGQQIYLGSGCHIHRIVIHEMMHAIGFDHEQSRPDRDKHITIYDKNILSLGKDGYSKLSYYKWDNYGSPYDYYSVMHYASSTFSNKKGPTMVTKKGEKIHNEQDFSYNDLLQINKMYSCPKSYFDKLKRDFNMVDCKDLYSASRCKQAKSSGRCIERSWRQKCPLTCGVCYKGTKYPSKDKTTSFKLTTTSKTTTTTTKPKTTTTARRNKCVDTYKYCAINAKKGYCNNAKYRSSMRVMCRKSCKFCSPTTTSKPTTPKPTTPKPTTLKTTTKVSTCRDLKRKCSNWKRLGHCKMYRSHMQANCPLTCGFCTTTTTQPTTTTKLTTTKKPRTTTEISLTRKPTPRTNCKDNNKGCKNWAKKGYCRNDKYKLFMSNDCKLSCKICVLKTTTISTTTTTPKTTTPKTTTTTPKTTTTRKTTTRKPTTVARKTTTLKPTTKFPMTKFTTLKPVCKNKDKRCKAWSKYCSSSKFEVYMRINCKKTCKYCT